LIRAPNLGDYLIIVMLGAIWGSAFLAIKVAVVEVGPMYLLTSRVLIGFLVLSPWVLVRGISLPKSGEQWALVAAIVLLNVVAPFYLIAWAELTIDSSVTSLMMGMGPLLGIVASHFTTEDDKLTWHKLAAVSLGLIGITLIVGHDALTKVGENIPGQLAAFLGSLCYVCSGVLIRTVRDIPATRLTWLVLGIASSVLVFANLFNPTPIPTMVSSNAIIALLFLGIFSTGLGYICRYYLINKIGFSYYALSVNLVPIFGVFMGVVFLGELLTWQMLAALILIVTGMIVARLSPLPATAKPAAKSDS
jgi:drug/metabolite transporter (DMT)-like permease